MSRDRDPVTQGVDPPDLADDIEVLAEHEVFETRGPQSFDSFYRNEYRSLVGLAYALCGNRTASEELVQDAFLTAYQKWGEVGSYERPDFWIRTVLVNRTRSWGRRRSAEMRAMTRIKSRRESLITEMAEPDHEFWEAVRDLPKRQAQAIALHYLEDRPVDEIAEILDCASGTVKSCLHRGRAGLSTALSLSPPTSSEPSDTPDSTDTPDAAGDVF